MRARVLVPWTVGILLIASATGYFFGWIGFALAALLGVVGLTWSMLGQPTREEPGGHIVAKAMERRWKAERDVTPGL